MITPLTFTIYKQRSAAWASQRLGTVDGTTLGGFGCLISTIAMINAGFDPANPLNPGQVDDLFTNNGGYANGNLVIWNATSRLLPHVAHVGMDSCTYSAAPIDKIKNHLDNGGLVALQVGFGGDINKMHWVLGDGYNGDNIIKCDPWYGDETDFSSLDLHGRPRFGTGVAAQDILAVHYFAQGVTPVAPTPVADPPAKPVARLPTENPIPLEETIPDAIAEVQPDPITDVPVTVLAHEYETTYRRVNPEERTIVRTGATAIAVASGEVVATLAVDQVISVTGYFNYQNNEYARTTWADTNNAWNGINTVYFTEPTGQPSGSIPITVVPNPPPMNQSQTRAAFLGLPDELKISIWQHFTEYLSQVIAAIFHKGVKK